MRLPQIILVAWYVLTLGYTLAMDGKPKEGNHSFGQTFITVALVMVLLWWGGFFHG